MSFNPILTFDPMFKPEPPLSSPKNIGGPVRFPPMAVQVQDEGGRVATLFPDGVVETYDGYSARRAAAAIWSGLVLFPGINHQGTNTGTVTIKPSWSFFVGDNQKPLVTVYNDGTVGYAWHYRPDPIAKELWETLAATYPK
jgi:hypothetical protein